MNSVSFQNVFTNNIERVDKIVEIPRILVSILKLL